MNAISKALDEIKFTIPIEVLEQAFKNEDYRTYMRVPLSIDERILLKVIRPRVLVDCNLVGGQMDVISLDGLVPEFSDNYSVVYHIPKDRTKNRSIVAALSVGYAQRAMGANGYGMNSGNVSPMSMNNVTSVGQRVMDAVSNVPPVSTANVTLIGENTILIKDSFRVTTVSSLRCILANDENMNNISIRSYDSFSELCILAVKSYIYKTLIIKIDQAFLQGGQELGAMKSYIESLSDAEENYRTFLKNVWRAVAFMNDTQSYTRHIRLQVNPAL